MKNIIEKIEKENEKLKFEKNEALDQKNQFEDKYNEILQTNFSKIRPNNNNGNILYDRDQNLSRDSTLENKQLDFQLTMMREEMEHMNIEKAKLKEAMNEAVNKCAAYVMMEKEWKQKLQEKDRQINNLQNSKSLLQQTFTDQIYALRFFKTIILNNCLNLMLFLRNQVKYLEDENEKVVEQNHLIAEENVALKTIVKRNEKNKLNR